MTAQPHAILIAGPNGAGKTTFAREYLPGEPEGLPQRRPHRGGPLAVRPRPGCAPGGSAPALARRRSRARRESFTVETTLSGHGYARSIPQWQTAGYGVTLIFLALPDVDTAIARVAERVRQGGHDIPVPTIRRRFEAGRHYFETVFKPLVDEWLLIDNAGDAPVLIDRSTS